MRSLYKLYCRSATRLSCNPVPLFIGLVIFGLAWAFGRDVAAHKSAIIHGFMVAAATLLTVIAGALLITAMQTVVRAVGTHAAPACPVPAPRRRRAVTEPVTGPVTGPVPVPVSRPGEPAFTYMLRSPAETAAMEADAAELAHEDTGLVASPSGGIYVLAGDNEDAAS